MKKYLADIDLIVWNEINRIKCRKIRIFQSIMNAAKLSLPIRYALLNILCHMHCLCHFTKQQKLLLYLLFPKFVFITYIWHVAILRLLVLTLNVTLFILLWNHIFQNTHISSNALQAQDKPIATLTTLTIYYWSCSYDALLLNKFCI